MDYQGASLDELTKYVVDAPSYRISMALKYYKDKEDTETVDKILEARKNAQILRLEKKLTTLRN